jgi:hypothetical protein
VKERRIYRVAFFNQGQVYEIYAKSVSQEDLYGFLTVEQLLFGERTQVVVDPSEERLKAEFEGVKKIHVPMHAVVRVDEVTKEGHARIAALPAEGGAISPFVPAVYGKPGDGSRKR